MDYGLLLTTDLKIFTVNGSGYRSQLTNNGSVLIPWYGLSRIEVEGESNNNNCKIFYPPKENVILEAEIIKNTDKEDITYNWLEMYHANHSLENDIIRMTINEVELIKKEAMSKKTHLSIWASVAIFIIVGMILCAVCWRYKFKNTVLIQTLRV